MSDTSNTSLRRIFDLVIAAAPADRPTILARECKDDASLRRRIEAMVAGAEDDRFLSAPTVDTPPNLGDAASSVDSLTEAPGSFIGPYQLLELIGEGGFGSVFMAAQSKPVARKVALKIVKLGMDTRQVVARFEQERQALAIMDHPHVAKVFDAGATPTGRPFFVMELCNGEPITRYCDHHRLSIEQRLSLFTQVCQAVQHAHQKGLIHRDIKPSNVLVATQDGRPHAKIIDFGIAKATASKLTEKTLFTEHKQLIGTPEYMSPEQAEGSLDIDTRTDVYSLGVLLYELLTGSTPFDSKSLRSAAYGEIQRIIREVDPPKPSTRLQQSADTAASVASSRDVEPKRLGTLVRGELDWIVMKALEKDRARRYDSANALGADIERYCAGEAVLAAPASRTYRLRKFIRKHKGTVTATGAVMIALAIGAAAFAWQAREARTERDKAQTERNNAQIERNKAQAERDKAQLVAQFMSETLKGVGPSVARGRDTVMLKEMMDAAAARIDKGELRGSPDAELRLRDTIGNAYRELSQYPEATKMLDPALALARRDYKGDSEQVVEMLEASAHVDLDTSNLPAAETKFREALAMNRRLFAADSSHIAQTLNGLALAVQAQGNLAEAETLLRESIGIFEKHKDTDEDLLGSALDGLADVLFARGALPEAEENYRKALEIYRRVFPGDHPRTVVVLTNLANTLQNRGDLAGAGKLFTESMDVRRRLFPHDHFETAIGLTGLAVNCFARGDYERAEPLLREALEIDRKLFAGQDQEQMALLIGNLATVLHSRGDLDGAEPLFAESIAMKKRLTPTGSADIARSLCNLAQLQRGKNENAAAEASAREAITMCDKLFSADHPQKALAHSTLALVLQDREDNVGAEGEYRQAIDIWRRVFKGDHQSLANGLTNLATLLISIDKDTEAESMAREAVGMFERVAGPNYWLTGTAHLRLGQALYKLHRFAEAEKELTHAVDVLSTAQGAPRAQLRDAMGTEIQNYQAWDKADPSMNHADEIAQWKMKLHPTTAPASKPATAPTTNPHGT